MTGPASMPDSASQVVPVISPQPLSVCHAPKTGSQLLPRGRMAVTPVRTAAGGSLEIRAAWPAGKWEISVVWPTVTPATSVMALYAPGVPSNGMPRSRARGLLIGGFLHGCTLLRWYWCSVGPCAHADANALRPKGATLRSPKSAWRCSSLDDRIITVRAAVAQFGRVDKSFQTPGRFFTNRAI